MAERPPCRRWGAVNVLMRLKNRIREKFFWDRILTDPDPDPMDDSSTSAAYTGSHGQHHDDSSTSAAYTGGHGQHDDDSSMNHHTLQDYFDAMDHGTSEGAPVQENSIQTASSLQFAVGPFMQMLQAGGSSTTAYDQESFLTLADIDMDDGVPWTSPAQMPYQQGAAGNLEFSTPIYAEYGCAEEYVDARMELPDHDQTISVQNYNGLQSNVSYYNSASTTPGHLSRVTTEMMDTGDSSSATTLVQPALQPAHWQQIMFFRQFLEIDEVGGAGAGAGWRVVLSIVSAFRRLSGLVRIRRSQRNTSGEITSISGTPRRIGPGTKYKGIRARNGKWVSEIRIGGTPEKVWLGSYNTEKEAALAFDAGKHHCSTRRSRFNFADSPRLLGAPENLLHLSSADRRTRIQRLAEDHARTYGNADIR